MERKGMPNVGSSSCGAKSWLDSEEKQCSGDITSLRPQRNCPKESKTDLVSSLCRNGEGENRVAALECSVWGLLPDELQAPVLEKLVFPSLVTFRAVCKRWNEAILSPWFHPSLLDCQRKCVPLYFMSNIPPTIFNKRQNVWQQMSWSFLDTPSNMLSLFATARGLLCFGVCGSALDLLVCNPITKQSRRLSVPSRISLTSISLNPTLPQRIDVGCDSYMRAAWTEISRDKEGALGMLADGEGRSYRIVVAGVRVFGPSDKRGTLVYFSATNSWTRGGNVPPGLRFWRTCKPVVNNGCIYFMSFWEEAWAARRQWRSHPVPPWNVARYDVKTHEWVVIPLPEPHGELPSNIVPHLIEHQDRILIVQGVEAGRIPVGSAMVVSELTANGRVVRLAKSPMPMELFPIKGRFAFSGWTVGQGNQLYVVGIYSPLNDTSGRWTTLESGNMKCFGFDVFSQNPTDSSWTPLPDLRGLFSPEGFFGFEPSLANV